MPSLKPLLFTDEGGEGLFPLWFISVESINQMS